MITVTGQQLDGWLLELFWPFVRIGSCFMVAPAFGSSTVPARVRIVLAGAVTFLVAPLVTIPEVTPLSAAGVVITIQQVIIGFLLYIPFVIIDLVTASVLMSMGMMMVSPVLISLPFKLMLFVLVDGWALVMGTLAQSFYH